MEPRTRLKQPPIRRANHTRGRTILTEYMLYVVADKLHFFIAGNSKQISRVRLYRPGQLFIAANQTTDDDEDLTIYHLIWRISDCWSSRGSGWWQWGVVGWSQTRSCEWWVVQAGAAATFFCRTHLFLHLINTSFRAAVLFWGKTTWNFESFVPKRGLRFQRG